MGGVGHHDRSHVSRSGRWVFIDSCAVNRFALINVDPIKALAESEFRLAITSDLEAEYRQALAHLYVEPYVKALIQNLLRSCVRQALFGFDGPPWSGFDDGVFASEDAMLVRNASPTSAHPTKALPRNRTDSHLVALAQTQLVITDDAKLCRRWMDKVAGLIPWPHVERHLEADERLVDLLRNVKAFT